MKQCLSDIALPGSPHSQSAIVVWSHPSSFAYHPTSHLVAPLMYIRNYHLTKVQFLFTFQYISQSSSGTICFRLQEYSRIICLYPRLFNRQSRTALPQAMLLCWGHSGSGCATLGFHLPRIFCCETCRPDSVRWALWNILSLSKYLCV